ncbi:Hsp70 family protein [Planctomycetota bacterium]
MNVPDIVGIDLGTTNSAISRIDRTGRPVTITNAEGDLTTPSAVLFDGPDIIVGREAIRAMHSEPQNVAHCAKRDIGIKKVHATIDGVDYPPEVIQAFVLQKLKNDACEQLGRCEMAVVTVPAYYDDARRKATQDAGYIAGLKVVDIINEPTAAALAIGVERGFLSSKGKSTGSQKMLVYDLGGGTFDVTVINVDGSELTTLAIDGDVRLGGLDWDECLVEYVAEEFTRHHGFDPRSDLNLAGRLWRECEEAKHTLTARQKAHVNCDFRGKSLKVSVTRELFNERTRYLLARTEFTTCEVLKAAGITWGEIDQVLQVGGSCRMPMVSQMLQQLSSQQPVAYPSPDEVVAHGAAIHANLQLGRHLGRPPTYTVRHVNARSLGIVAKNPRSGHEQNAILIHRNKPLPTKVRRMFRTDRAHQKSVRLSIVEGESERPDECTKLGNFVVRPLPPNLPAGTPIEVKFGYDSSARLKVQVKIDGADQGTIHQLERENGLGSQQRERWKEFVSKAQLS